MEHRDHVIRTFTRQADRFAQSSHVNRADDDERFLRLLDLGPSDRVLDVACGPGLLAHTMAPRVAEVVGVDLTPAMLEKGRHLAQEAGLHNVAFQEADAVALPFPDATFNVVVTRLSLHHMAEPARALHEMARVLVPGGRLGILDQVTSERPDEEAWHNRLERMRDPSHTRALPLSEICHLAGTAGLRVTAVDTIDHEQEVEDWLDRAGLAPEAAAEIRSQVRAAAGTPLFGGRRVTARPDGTLTFTCHWALVRAHR